LIVRANHGSGRAVESGAGACLRVLIRPGSQHAAASESEDQSM
jgi:hypothetical protein